MDHIIMIIDVINRCKVSISLILATYYLSLLLNVDKNLTLTHLYSFERADVKTYRNYLLIISY